MRFQRRDSNKDIPRQIHFPSIFLEKEIQISNNLSFKIKVEKSNNNNPLLQSFQEKIQKLNGNKELEKNLLSTCFFKLKKSENRLYL